MSYQVDSYGNAYFPAGVSVASIPATTGTQSKVLVPGPGGKISSATISQLITQSGGSVVSSIFGRTGDVTAQQGDYNTDQVTEGQALYFTTSRARKSIYLTTFNTSGPATYDSGTGILNIPQYGSGSGGNYVPLTRTITINGQTADLSSDRIFSVDPMVYPSIGIPLSNGTSWGTSIANNSANWNTAYGWGNHASAGYLTSFTETDPIWISEKVNYYTKTQADARYLQSYTETDPIWTSEKANYALKTYVDTSISNLVASAPAALNTLNELALALGSDANFSTTVTTLIGTKEAAITAGTTLQYWRGDKTWQSLPIYDLTPYLTISTASSTYVPYNGATANVNLGSHPLLASTLSVLGSGTTAGYLSFTTNTNNGYSAWTSQAAYGTSAMAFSFMPVSGQKLFNFDASGLTTSIMRTYTMPNASGTLALTSDIIVYTLSGLGGEPSISAGTTSQYWRGDKTWQTLPSYSLPIATGSILGGIKVGSGLSINATTGVLDATYSYTLPTASTTVLGGVKVDGTTITINGSGVISGANTYSLPIASATVLGGIKVGTNLSIDANGVLSSSYTDTNTWNANSKDVAGYVAAPGAVANKVWKTDGSGNPAWRDDADTVYSLPTATGSVLGGVKIGNGISISSGVISNYIYDSRNTRGATRLYRRDDDSDYSVQTYWTGTHWFLRGYNGDTFHAETRVSYSDSTGSVAWSNVSGRPTAVSSFTNDASYITSASNVVGLYGSGYGNGNYTWYQTSGTFAGYTGWASYLISNHGDGSNYYNQTIIMPFWGAPQYSRREANVLKGPYGFITDENISTQSVNYSASSGSVAWTNVSGRPSALSSFTNDLGNYGSWYSTSGGTISGNVVINGSSNAALTINEAQPYLELNATGASNTAGVRIYPTAGYDANIGNYRGGALNLLSNSVVVAKVTHNAGVIFYVGGTGPITAVGTNTSAYNIFVNSSASNKTWDISLYNNDWILNESNVTSRLKVLAGGGVYADAFYEFSDKRFKTLVKEDPIINIGSITSKLYVKEGKTELGYYAQDFIGVLDSAILTDKDGVLSLSYRQVHTAKIAALEKRIAELEAKLNSHGL